MTKQPCSRPILFLDIDGVLNGHQHSVAGDCCTIQQPCVRAFNLILDRANPMIVLSSAWRYMVWSGSCTLRGFESMLRTHGIGPIVGKMIGLTPLDEMVEDRSNQIRYWLRQHRHLYHKPRYVVLDDMDIKGHPFVQTDGAKGLTRAKARETIGMLRVDGSRLAGFARGD